MCVFVCAGVHAFAHEPMSLSTCISAYADADIDASLHAASYVSMIHIYIYTERERDRFMSIHMDVCIGAHTGVNAYTHLYGERLGPSRSVPHAFFQLQHLFPILEQIHGVVLSSQLQFQAPWESG